MRSRVHCGTTVPNSSAYRPDGRRDVAYPTSARERTGEQDFATRMAYFGEGAVEVLEGVDRVDLGGECVGPEEPDKLVLSADQLGDDCVRSPGMIQSPVTVRVP